MQTMHAIANNINIDSIIQSTLNKDDGFLSRFLGHDSKDRMSNAQSALIVAPLKRKADILPQKYVISAIDSHVKDCAPIQFQSITELIFKLKEICESDLHFVRFNFK